MENVANQMAFILDLLKEQFLESLKPELQSISKEVISSLKCELQSITKEVISMKDMIRNLEKTMKKSLTPSIPPSDLLPNANSATCELPQLPTMSVTIPPHPLRNQHLESEGGISKTINSISSSVGTTDNSSAAVSVASTKAFNKYATFSCKPEVEAPAVFDSFKDNNSTMALINCTSKVIGTISSSTSASSVTSTNTSINTISSSKNITTASPFASNNLNKSPTAAFSIATAITTSVVPVMVSKENATSNLNKSAASDTGDDHVPISEFQAVIPLPDVVEIKTGEENEIVLFEHRAKLMRFDKKAGEWKERGLGNFKLLQDKHDIDKLRVLMRREQVHKLCCNQRVYKDTAFIYRKNSDTALSWAGLDFSDNELLVEILTIRFKTPEVCKQFLKALNEAQDRMSAEGKETNVQSSKASSEAVAKNTVIGSCLAYGSPKDKVSPKSTVSNIVAPISKSFNIGLPATGAANTMLTPSLPTQFTFTFQKSNVNSAIACSDKRLTTDLSQTSLTSIGAFEDQFKPNAGSWACQACNILNGADKMYCVACGSPKDNKVSPKSTVSNIVAPISKSFNFGFAATGAANTMLTPSLPTQFTFTFQKSNVNSEVLTTDLSQTSLTSAISKKESNTNGLFLSDLAQKFRFSFPVAKISKSEIITPKVDFAFNAGSTPTKGVFTFTTSSTTSTSLSDIPNTTMLPNPAAVESSDKLGFLNGLPQQNTEALILTKMNTGQESAKEAFSLNRKVFNFILKPKCSGKSCKSPSKFDSVADDAEDEDTKSAQLDEWQNSVHTTQSIPLPGKNKKIADKFMKAVKKTLDGNTSPKVEIAGTSTSVRTSASLGPTASNMTEETDNSSFLSFTGHPSNENTTADGCIFGSGENPATTTTHVATSLFERLTVTTTTGSANTGPFVDLSKTATAAIGFASLAAKASKDDKVTIAFAKGKEKPGPGNFIGLTDQNAFARFAKPLAGVNDAKSNQTDSCSSAENNFNDKNYDPHYEPVIALPAEIVITTGEEEETKLFGERATLFRWDDTSKEWKERGVGELKILFHPIKQTYRMLMRREKIYKLILNHLVNTEFSFNEMKKNPKSFLWGTMNYAECPEGVLEELAVRFKNVILAELFREQLNKCIAANQNRAN
uniref:RanBP2-type domain-containing protein n=1 Tax=Glossina palpalis gambiensis TaxID=67801 RepID=A0A1B0B792_9MUSC